MRGRPIIWDAAKLDRLEDAIRESTDGVVRIADVPRHVKVSEPTHEWPIEDARIIMYEARLALEANPMPQFGENREGKEP